LNYYYYYYYYWFDSPFVGPWQLFQFVIPKHTRWDCLDEGSVYRNASIYTEDNKHRKYAQTNKPRVGFEITITVLQLAKTIHVLDSAASVISI
jgi:hypothetical protein